MILVTGGTGFVGAHLLYELLKNGEKPKALKRKNSSLQLTEKIFSYYTADYKQVVSQIEWITGDIDDIVSLNEAMKGVTQIYHCAAEVSFESKDKLSMFNTNIKGTANIVDAALKSSVRKLCYVSSIAAIGRAENEDLINEETTWKSSGRNSNYAKSKYAAEREVWRGIEEGLNAVIVNPSVILGPGNWESGSSKIFQTMWKGTKFYTNGVNGFIDVRDVAKAMVKLMNSSIENQRYILSSENLSYKELFTRIMTAFGKKPPQFKASLFLLNFAWRFEKLKSTIFNSKPMITKETVNTSQNKYLYSSAKIKQELSFDFTPINQSIVETCLLFEREYRNFK
ncbi:MAG: NAD-dependent epimerase/dehydratase family protein [Bacteroidetes bacterium]|nr:NAD-dependent epimerase/dehydratase family protein [Bacteroidota bacterium]